MREIKFRLWDKEEKKMYTPARIFADGFTLDFKSENKGGILMQYTGLKDKNGKEIYEGDILGWESDSIPNAEVIYNQKDCRFTPFSRSCPDDKWVFNGGEVIGNIYENPELLSFPQVS